jgi:hypothetical protein
VRTQRSDPSNVIVTLWLIGWLIVSVPITIMLMLLQLVALPTSTMTGQIVVLVWILGSIFVAPLLALGMAQFYLYVHDRLSMVSEPGSPVVT